MDPGFMDALPGADGDAERIGGQSREDLSDTIKEQGLESGLVDRGKKTETDALGDLVPIIAPSRS